MKQLDNPNPRNLNRDTAPLQQKIWKTSPCDILFKSWICFCTNFEFNGFNTHQLFQNWLLMVHLLSADLGSGVPVPLPKCLKWWVVGFSLVVSMLKVGVHFAVQPSSFVNLQVRHENGGISKSDSNRSDLPYLLSSMHCIQDFVRASADETSEFSTQSMKAVWHLTPQPPVIPRHPARQ